MGLPIKKIKCDFCVVGGGMAGLAAAISAAREGIDVVLMHERPVLGGNASSEIRMWVCGAEGENNRETGILEEIALENLYRNPTKNYAIWDTVLYDFVLREKNITLLLNCTCMDAKVEEGAFPYGRDRKIKTVVGYQMTTQTFFEVEAKYYCDSSGDSILAPLCGAEYRLGREAASEFNEDTSVEVADKMTMGMSCLFQARETEQDVTFIPPAFSAKLNRENFEKRIVNGAFEPSNFWYLELGGNMNTIDDTEIIREDLMSLAMGTWDYIKNSGDCNAQKWDLDFLGFLPGKRESRRMCGEYVITQRDIFDGRVFEDEIAYGGWPIDDHYPGGFYHKGAPNRVMQTPAPYSLPYRALYSKNVDNLFFAGRNISMTHMAMSSIRVMATCALLGEAVGKACALATNNGLTPHGVYLEKLSKLQTLLLCEDCFLPSKIRTVSKACKNASLTGADDCIRNGQDRAHKIYAGTENTVNAVLKNTPITYAFAKQRVQEVHIVFDSDLNRETLPEGFYERTRSMRGNRRLSDPQMYMPKTLCKEFYLIGERDGVEKELLHVTNNRKRAYHLNVDDEFEKLSLIVCDGWGDDEKIPVISFDFC